MRRLGEGDERLLLIIGLIICKNIDVKNKINE